MTIDTAHLEVTVPIVPSAAGCSAEAKQVSDEALLNRQRLQASYALGQSRVLEELEAVAGQCREENWDGYGAATVRSASVKLARQFLLALPLGTEAPSVGAEADGELTLEWYRSPRYVLSVSCSATGDLHYAALLGMRKAYGTEPFWGAMPRIVVDLIGQVRTSGRSAAA